MTPYPAGTSPAEAFSGVFVPATTPFDPVSGALDLVALRANLRRLLATSLRGVVIGGTTGESVLLTREERRAALEAARDLLAREQLLIAGTGAESTLETLRLGSEAAEAGADAILVQPPAFFRRVMERSHLSEHYQTVADESAVPVILYQVPLSCSTIELSTGLVAELSEHPNVIGLKDSRGDLTTLGEHLTQVGEGFQVFVGNGAKLYAALELGAAGGILGVANLVPVEVTEIFTNYKSGRTAEAGRIQERVAPLHNGIVGAHGVAGVKAALDMLGAHGGAPRRPLRPADEQTLEEIRKVLRSAGFLDTAAVHGYLLPKDQVANSPSPRGRAFFTSIGVRMARAIRVFKGVSRRCTSELEKAGASWWSVASGATRAKARSSTS